MKTSPRAKGTRTASQGWRNQRLMAGLRGGWDGRAGPSRGSPPVEEQVPVAQGRQLAGEQPGVLTVPAVAVEHQGGGSRRLRRGLERDDPGIHVRLPDGKAPGALDVALGIGLPAPGVQEGRLQAVKKPGILGGEVARRAGRIRLEPLRELPGRRRGGGGAGQRGPRSAPRAGPASPGGGIPRPARWRSRRRPRPGPGAARPGRGGRTVRASPQSRTELRRVPPTPEPASP